MNIGYSADEVFEIAEEIEREGEEFYLAAAAAAKDQEAKDLFLGLAKAEKDHGETFRRLRKDLVGGEGPSLLKEPDETVSLYLRAVAKGTVFQTSDRKIDKGELPATESEVLALAISKELESILYYVGMKSVVVDEAAGKAVESVMREEEQHVVQLAKRKGLF
jgi:rubrerythrin